MPREFPLPAQSAVKVSIGSIGGALDSAALRTVRKVVGHAISSGTVDIFVVTSPSNNGSNPIEGGISFCAEAGSYIVDFQFNEFINELKSIQPNQGTFYNIDLLDSCPVTIENDENGGEGQFCTQDAKICPDGSGVGRVPPSCEFSPCPTESKPKLNTK
ncbi:MAG: hypothetical protein KAH20_08080 [Methylococcales bacterium]|nr:hypothetical protein [Methylococcales bacterium]